jgi:hypothetical protein
MAIPYQIKFRTFRPDPFLGGAAMKIGQHLKFCIISCITLTAFIVITGCGGGGGGEGGGVSADSNGETVPDTSDNLPDFLASQLVAQQNALITAGEGGTVELNGASLTAPADALSQDTRLGLATVALSVNDLPVNDGARLGLKVVSPEAYLIFSTADVDLNKPLTLRLPVNPDLLSEINSDQDIILASQSGGLLVPLGPPTRVDLENRYVELDLDIPRLLVYGVDQIMTEAPRAASAEFLAVLAGLATTPWTWNAILVAVNDAQQAAAGRHIVKRLTPHFTIYIDENQNYITAQEIIAIENALETAYEVFVGEMGMDLPNLINLDGRYTVVIDDLKLYSIFSLPDNTPDGFTLAGSSIVEGISYIDTNIATIDQMKNTAVHEYFHALQWGALRSPFIWNIGDKFIDQHTADQSGWLFEGSAVALAGRLLEGDIIHPARDSNLDKRMPQGVSLTASQEKYGTAHDVAQDFFFYLERTLDEYGFYPDIFANISPLTSAVRGCESAVCATDTVLQDVSGGSLDMSSAWENFVVDYWVDNINLYSSNYSLDYHALDHDGTEIRFSYVMPSLSQRVFSLTVPALEKDAQGTIIPNQPLDLALEVTMTVDDTGTIRQVPVLIVDELKPKAAERYSWFASSYAPRAKKYSNFREENERTLYFVMSFSELNTEKAATLTFKARLEKENLNYPLHFKGTGISTNAYYNPGYPEYGTASCPSTATWEITLSESGSLYGSYSNTNPKIAWPQNGSVQCIDSSYEKHEISFSGSHSNGHFEISGGNLYYNETSALFRVAGTIIEGDYTAEQIATHPNYSEIDELFGGIQITIGHEFTLGNAQ